MTARNTKEQWIQECTWTLIDQRKAAKREREQAKTAQRKNKLQPDTENYIDR